jgi:hypothetical protein
MRKAYLLLPGEEAECAGTCANGVGTFCVRRTASMRAKATQGVTMAEQCLSCSRSPARQCLAVGIRIEMRFFPPWLQAMRSFVPLRGDPGEVYISRALGEA